MSRAAAWVRERWPRWKPWLQLLRLPNLLTVPGDPVAGYLLAARAPVRWPALAGAALASLCFYGVGLVLNDLLDLRQDRIERPKRPLPSGEIRPRSAWLLLLALAALGLGLLALLGRQTWGVGAALAGLVVFYNLLREEQALTATITLGLCRGLSLLLGACAAGCSRGHFSGVALVAAALSAYIALVSAYARNEARTPLVRPRRVGWLLSLLLPAQASVVLLSRRGMASVAIAVALFALWPLNRVLSRRFYAS